MHVLRAGPTFEVITNTNTGQVIGNYTLVYTQLNANTLAASLPSTFNASQSLTFGNYTAVITYAATSNFAAPSPLVVQFSVTVHQSLMSLHAQRWGIAHACPPPEMTPLPSLML